jgi:hypothetical protein
MKRAITLVVTFAAGIVLSACPGKGPKAPAACTAITEDTDPASDHCSKNKADCETTFSNLLHQNHQGRCSMPPCSAFSAHVDCTPTGQECEFGDGSFGQLFHTAEHVRCR